MMLEPAATEKIDKSFKLSIDGYLPWIASSENSGNRDLLDTVRLQTKKEASLFSLLGWETGMVIREVFNNFKEQYTDGAAISAKLATITISGPRGELKLDKETNHFTAPFYKFSSQQNSQPVIEQVAFSSAAWENYIQQPTGGVHSGWTNTYLCY